MIVICSKEKKEQKVWGFCQLFALSCVFLVFVLFCVSSCHSQIIYISTFDQNAYVCIFTLNFWNKNANLLKYIFPFS